MFNHFPFYFIPNFILDRIILAFAFFKRADESKLCVIFWASLIAQTTPNFSSNHVFARGGSGPAYNRNCCAH